MITTFYPPYNFGGDGVFVHALSNELARQGHLVDVIHCIDSYRLTASRPTRGYDNHPGVTMHGLESPLGFLSPLLTHQTGRPVLKRARIEAVLARGFDVIHYHNVSLVGGPGLLALGRAIKLYTLHDYWAVCETHALFRLNREPCARADACAACAVAHRRPPQWWRRGSAMRRALSHVDAFIAPTLTSQRKHEQMGFPGRIEHIPNFVARPAESTAHPARRAPTAAPYFLFVGRLERLKGLHSVIPVWNGYHRAQLWIAGTGSEAPRLRALAGGNPDVRFLGHQDGPDLDELYRNAVALIYPAVNFQTLATPITGVHGAPLVIMEAFTRGTPVIANRLGRIALVLAETGGGLAYSTAAELRTIMNGLLDDPSRRRELGGAGCRAVREQAWTAPAHLDRYFRLIDGLRPPSAAL